MPCPVPRPGSPEFLPGLLRRLVARRVPIAGSLELTRRCSLRCVHCYLGDARCDATAASALDTERACDLLAELADAGCLFLLITGGDPLLHPGFSRVYREARRRGMLVGVFTSGTAVTDDLLDLFADLRPSFIEISLYGATAATYEAVTGIPGSFGRCVAGIDRLASRGLPVELKTLLMTLNRHELPAMEGFAAARGLPFRFDTAVFPRWGGDRAPLALRLPPREAVAIEFSGAARAGEWRRFHERTRAGVSPRRLYACGAGETAFHVDADGRLTPCLMSRALRLPLSPGGFSAAWSQMTAAVAGLPLGDAAGCLACEARSLCGYCPGHFGLESGDESRPTPYHCEVGRYRLAAVLV